MGSKYMTLCPTSAMSNCKLLASFTPIVEVLMHAPSYRGTELSESMCTVLRSCPRMVATWGQKVGHLKARLRGVEN